MALTRCEFRVSQSCAIRHKGRYSSSFDYRIHWFGRYNVEIQVNNHQSNILCINDYMIFAYENNHWVNPERSTSATRREDERIWLRGVGTGDMGLLGELRTLADAARYRTTHVDARGRRRPMYRPMLEQLLGGDIQQMRRHSANVIRARPNAAPQRNHVIDAHTKYIGSNFTELNSLRYIPINKRVYLTTDVNRNGKIKHVYNRDGLERWIQTRRGQATSPFTRRRITMQNVRPLRD